MIMYLISKIFRLSSLTLVFSGMWLVSSCVKDLDTLPLTDNVLLPDDAWNDAEAYEQFLSKIYAGMSLSGNEGPAGMPDMTADDQGEATFLRSYWNLQQLATDEVIGAWDNETLRGLQFMQWNSNNNFIALNYTRIYLNIAYANEFIRETADEKLQGRGLAPERIEQIRQYRAEARALRALHYYFLMDLYANVPFIHENTPVGAGTIAEQKDRKHFFEWIIQEIGDIEHSLPSSTRANYGKFTQAAAWMLLAKIYLNAEVYVGQAYYDECLSYLNRIIEQDFSLDEDYRHIFGADNHLSQEIIFPLVYDGRRATTYGGTTFLLAASYKSDMNPGVNYGFTQSWSGIRAKEPLSESFSGDDKRALFWKDGRTQETTEWFDFDKGWSVVKFTNLNRDGSAGSNGVFADTDFPLFRLADAYLMYVEAVLRGGQGGSLAQGLLYLEAIRERADIPRVESNELDLDLVLQERSRELYWEAHRRTDLIRFGRFTTNYNWPWKNGIYAGVPNVDPKFNIYPLPAAEITANPGLVQNTGY